MLTRHTFLLLHYMSVLAFAQCYQQDAKCVFVHLWEKERETTCLDVHSEARGFYMREGDRQREAASLEEFKQPLCYVTGMEMTSLGQPVSLSPLSPPVNKAVRVIYCMSSNLTCQRVQNAVALKIWAWYQLVCLSLVKQLREEILPIFRPDIIPKLSRKSNWPGRFARRYFDLFYNAFVSHGR